MRLPLDWMMPPVWGYGVAVRVRLFVAAWFSCALIQFSFMWIG